MRARLTARILEHEEVDAAGREGLGVGRGRLALRAGEGFLNRGHVVEMQDRDEMIRRGSARGGYYAGAFSNFRTPGILCASGTCFSA